MQDEQGSTEAGGAIQEDLQKKEHARAARKNHPSITQCRMRTLNTRNSENQHILRCRQRVNVQALNM
jgi:hypothetical protein